MCQEHEMVGAVRRGMWGNGRWNGSTTIVVPVSQNNTEMSIAYGKEYQGSENRLGFNCECGQGFQYLIGKDGKLKIVCTHCNRVKDAQRADDRKYIREWIGCD